MTALRIRDVRLIVGAVGISAFGDFLLWVPLALHIEARHRLAAGAVGVLPRAVRARSSRSVASPGRLADRFENARLLWIVSLAQAAVGRPRWRSAPARSPR